jgi:hypothetical protein
MIDEPDIKLAGLSLWALEWQFPESHDFWDGNWLNIRASVEAHGAFVEISGPWLRNDELAAFREQLAKLERDLTGEAELHCIEPALNVKVRCGSLGHVEVEVAITPDHLTQTHRFIFEADQSYLKPVLRGCARILERFPQRGSRE